MRRTREPNRRERGFSLIELLAVVGILVILMAVLMPSLGRARVQARDTQCLSRLRQLFIAHTQYIHENLVLPPLNDAFVVNGISTESFNSAPETP